MSTPVYKRKLSKVEYVAKAGDIFMKTSKAMFGLPKRWQNFRCDYISKTAYELLDHVASANLIYVRCRIDFDTRRQHLLDARAKAFTLLNLIDALLRESVDLQAKIEAGVLSRSTKDPVRKKYKMLVAVVDEILDENELIKGVLDSDLKIYKEKFGDNIN